MHAARLLYLALRTVEHETLPAATLAGRFKQSRIWQAQCVALHAARAEAPQVHQRTDRGIEGTGAVHGHGERGIEHGEKILRQGMPAARRRAVETADEGIGFPGAHLVDDPLQPGRDGRCDHLLRDAARGQRLHAPGSAHGLPGQALERHIRRHEGRGLQVDGDQDAVGHRHLQQ